MHIFPMKFSLNSFKDSLQSLESVREKNVNLNNCIESWEMTSGHFPCCCTHLPASLVSVRGGIGACIVPVLYQYFVCWGRKAGILNDSLEIKIELKKKT